MKGGFIYESERDTDYPICMAMEDSGDTPIPESFRTSFQPPYADQKSTGNCVAQTLANILEVMLHKVIGEHEDFSVGFIYGNRYDGQSKSAGMTGYAACGNLCKDGDVMSSVFDSNFEVPYIIEKVEAFKKAHPEWKELTYVPTNYIRTKKAKEVKKFIMKYDIPVMAVVKVSKFWFGEGYHAMALYGWDGDVAIMQNSWGEDSNAKIVELDFDDIKEFWMITPAVMPQFCDLPDNHWAFDDIMKCIYHNIMLGYPDGTFGPSKDLTRAEMAAIIYRMMKEEGKI